MATKKAAKKAAKGAKKSAKAASKKTGKKSASTKSPAKKVSAKHKPAAKKHRPAKKSGTGRPRSTPLIVEVESSGLTLEVSPASPVGYEMVLFVDKARWTTAQQAKIEAFVADLGLNAVALGKGWGGP